MLKTCVNMRLSWLLCVILLMQVTRDLLGADVRSSIVGGRNAVPHKWKWMAHVNVTNSVQRWRCGGSLLTEQWVLTSASCFYQNEPIMRRTMVWLGSHNLHESSRYYRGVVYVIKHPNYSKTSNGAVNDVAMLKMKTKAHFTEDVSEVTLPAVDAKFGPDSECLIIGWGNVATGVPLPGKETLQELEVPIVDKSACEAVYGELGNGTLCAGYLQGGNGACDGDYGGPLMCRVGNSYVQAGIMSFGNPQGCAMPGSPTVFSQVTYYLKFINETLPRVHEPEASSEI